MSTLAHLMEKEDGVTSILDEMSYLPSPISAHFLREMSAHDEVVMIGGHLKISP